MQATGTVIHSKNPIIRQAINYGMRGLMSGLMKGVEDPYIETATGTVGGAIGGAFVAGVEYLAPGYGTYTSAAIDGAISGVTGNIRGGDLSKTARASALMALSGTGAAMLSKDSDLSGLAISSTSAYLTKNSTVDALYGSIQRNLYNSVYKTINGKAALDERNFDGFMQAYFISAGLGKLSKEVIYDVSSTIAKQLHSYINYAQSKAENIEQFTLLSSASEAIGSTRENYSSDTKKELPIALDYNGINLTELYPGLSKIGMLTDRNNNHTLPTSSLEKSLAQQNLQPLSQLQPNQQEFAAVAAFAALAVNQVRKFIFRKPVQSTTPSKKPKESDKGRS